MREGVEMTSWSEHYVDRQVDKAWLGLRMNLAERFEAGLASGAMVPIDITAPTGETLSVNLVDDQVVVMAGDSVVVTENVDEAAYAVYEILHENWQVTHPVFLDSSAVEIPCIDDNPAGTVVPTLGTADSKATLQAWVVTTFQESCDEPLRVRPSGDIGWRGLRGTAATVSVRDEHWIEVWSVLATEVGFKKARKVAERLSRRYTGVNFSFRRDMIVMSRMVDAGPFVPQHLTDALAMHLDLATKLSWVQEAVLRKRVKAAREQAVPGELMALLPSANRVATAALANQVGAAAGSSATLQAWREVCRRERRRARRLPRGADDPHRVNYRLRMGWTRLGRAIDVALELHGEVGDVA